ncbi:tryptophan synthase subunit alpha [Thermocladium modestius]|uniref:tryptophan synthase n=1 Tax=Thermocladium modestius TaxID=62609 RepID=A0A830GRH4_9CREN|nr:tryptophan synthase subunit alpha [Thermocladium modestius]GGP18878.1 tryptophan synthase subunit alpha [Thermocladium modestius]
MEISRPSLGLYITATYPDSTTFKNVLNRTRGIVDFYEIGIPTNNPKYDGPIIRMTHFKSQLKGLEAVKVANYEKSILMGYIDDYVNSLDAVAEIAAQVGASAILFPDLLFDHFDRLDDYVKAMRSHGLDTAFFVSSKTPHKIIERVASLEPLFIYLGLYASTGTKLPVYIERNVSIVRKLVGDTYLVTGFAVRDAGMVRALIEAGANGVVVGTAFIERMGNLDDAMEFLRGLREGL